MEAKVTHLKSLKRFWVISDIHFGVRSNSLEWLEIQADYFNNFFIPLLEEKLIKGDEIMIAGDLFDSRQSINLKVMNTAMSIIEKLSKLATVRIICGNHDIYHKKINDVNSIKFFSWLPNVFVYENPEMLVLNSGKSILLLPWVHDPEEEGNIVEANPADYYICHTDFVGVKFSRNVTVEHGINPGRFKKQQKVYSGHIHYRQKMGQITMVGCPYQMTRSDIGNEKGVYLLDFETDEETFFVNNYSPKFYKINIDDLLEMPLETAQTILRNNFTDVLVQMELTATFPFSAMLDLFNNVGYRKFDYVLVGTGQKENSESLISYENEDGDIDMVQLIEQHIKGLGYKENITNKLIETAIQLYKDALNKESLGIKDEPNKETE